MSSHHFFALLWNFEVVRMDVVVEVLVSQNIHYFDQLVMVVFALEKGLNSKEHSSKSASKRPNV